MEGSLAPLVGNCKRKLKNVTKYYKNITKKYLYEGGEFLVIAKHFMVYFLYKKTDGGILKYGKSKFNSSGST